MRRLTNQGLLVWLLLIVTSCGGHSNDVSYLPDESIAVPDTTLGIGDVFDIRVYGEDDLSSTFRVASDGTINYPLLGVVAVEGMTPSQVAESIEAGLRENEFLKKPQVSILVKEYTSKKISIFGQVKKPGTFPHQDGMSVVEAISLAGGFNAMAKKNDTTVIRIVQGNKKKFKVPVEAIGQGRAANFTIQPGDIIFVPERIF
jgi:protein involved in polysaccharide export with SLBB domain